LEYLETDELMITVIKVVFFINNLKI